MSVATASLVADYFLASQDEDAGDLISNLKLQKLLYYSQGLYLAYKDGQPLFEERIYAWKHGPVVPEIYHKFKAYGSAPIPVSEDFDLNNLTPDEQEFLKEVYSVYGQFSAWKLRSMTHSEPPYKMAEPDASEITHESMRDYFAQFVTP